MVTKTLRKRLLWALVIAAGLTAAVYHGSGYLIGAIYGGAMKAYRAKHTPAIPKPPGWATDNFYLGRWQGLTTAGMDVNGVLTVEPNRIRFGNQPNGICESDYTVKFLPMTTNLRSGVVQLTLQPGPCRTGTAVIQLAMPLDGSHALEVVTLDATGKPTGYFGAEADNTSVEQIRHTEPVQLRRQLSAPTPPER